ncbi:MAG: hypothetical protein OHK0039_47690 [Bacteroidia bacterium]
MAIKYFATLAESEVGELLKAPARITVLISAADGTVHSKETEWARKLVGYRAFTAHVKLHDYYEAVQTHFDAELQQLIAHWSGESTALISGQLADLQPILAKLEPEVADLLRESWRSLARRVAEAEGGLLGFGTVNKEEQSLVDLPMIG